MADSEIPDYDEFRRTGIYMGADQLRVAFSDYVADPGAHPLATPSGRVELASRTYADQTGFSALPECRVMPADRRYPLRLITPKPKYRVHSQGNNIPEIMARDEPVLWMHPEDAAPRHITQGQLVCVQSPQGTIQIPVRVTAEMMPGVVCLLEGVWPALQADGSDVAGCANVATSIEPTLPSQASRTHSVLVEVSPL
ncbi:MAG TPA: molybdopterin dinucleotide binding domain-containing protein [Anaerolineae bacterium]|nr:molybdopterin dinucleotide binding domain-containing protein [Anaerolineae bacterium]HOQ97275.1 molybdopterin dinucleotide binding domain-containing protein [Anaerolineae bacterium]HPL27593.1 molybdopterin dinucleotide binding domain-containing protein [Anaerolineae bacterium]